MNKEKYQKIYYNIGKNKYKVLLLNYINNFLTFLIFISYPILLLYVYFFLKKYFLRLIIVPFISFIIISVLRKYMNRKRPYEVYDFKPLIKKDTVRNSFPSRHIFSAFMIFMSYFIVNRTFSTIIFIISLILSVLRVIGGVHFIKDVVVGAILGISFAIIGYYIIF